MRYEAFVQQGYQEAGVTYVIVTRTDNAGWLQAGAVIVDLFCLGVKDAFTIEMSAIEWSRELDRLIPSQQRVAIHPACARKLVEGAVAYAESLGFAPYRDYKKARRVFGGVNARDCPETFTYGKNGKPFFVAGPNDDEERIDRVLRMLTAKLGPDGFHYIVPQDPDALAESVRADFQALFLDRPEGAVGFAKADGFFTALHVCPDFIQPSDFLPALWGDAQPEFKDEDGARQVLGLAMEYWNEVGDRLRQADDTDPGWAVDFGDDLAGADETPACARAWCQGFLRALEKWPEHWQGAPDRRELQRDFDAIRALADSAAGSGITAEEPSLHVGRAVIALYGALRPPRRPR